MPINQSPLLEKSVASQPSKKNVSVSSFQLSAPRYSFSDVILREETLAEIQNALALYRFHDLIFDSWGFSAVLHRPKNLSINLYGDSGTGKTITTHAIAHQLQLPLLMVNYAEIESKYVGETAKNLASLFDFASTRTAVLVFDEADALLSKRVTDMRSAADVSVNQTRSVLLRLLDEYEGIILFTTNFIQNFDPAFHRRIMYHIRFNLPDRPLREKLWAHYLVPKFPLAEDRKELIAKLAEREGLSGSDIATAVLRTAVHTALAPHPAASYNDFMEQLDKIQTSKDAMHNSEWEISSRKVSESYVKEKLGKDVVNHGNS